MYVSVVQLVYEIWLKTKCAIFWIFMFLLMNSLFSYENAKFEKLIFSYFLQYLLNYLTYRDVQYLILILRRFYFDLLKCHLSVGVTVLKLQSCKVVHFFFVHPLGAKYSTLVVHTYISWRRLLSLCCSISQVWFNIPVSNFWFINQITCFISDAGFEFSVFLQVNPETYA